MSAAGGQPRDELAGSRDELAGPRAVLFCPGRGSYTEPTMGSLAADDPFVRRAEEIRAGYDLPTLVELDGAERFSPSRHLRPANVSPLIFLRTFLDARAVADDFDVVAVGGNSLGWYSALAVAGALEFDEGFRLVQEMSILQEQHGADGGQLIYPLVDDDWRPDPERAAAVQRALAELPRQAFPSIDLGGYAVLAGTEEGTRALLERLPPAELRGTRYPFRLVQHGPYHTHLQDEVGGRARVALRLGFRRPETTLVDGHGRRHSPWSADPVELERYTFGAQVSERFSFTDCVRVALREFAPERIVLTGPGNSLGGVVGQVLVSEGWRGVRSKADFDAVQRSDAPIVVSLGR